MTLQEMLGKDPRWQRLMEEQEHRIIGAKTITAIRTPWLYNYQDSSRGHTATKNLVKKIAKASKMSFPNIEDAPFKIEKYVKERMG